MLLIFCLEKAFLLISIPGAILTNLLGLIVILVLISLMLQLVLNLSWPHPINQMVLHTSKQVNDVYHPCSSNGALTLANEHSYQVQTGAKLVPEYPVDSLAESDSQLKKTAGRAFKMHSSWYRSRKYIIGLDLENIPGARFTGMSTKAGDLLTINFRDCDALGNADSVPNRVFCALNYDCVLNTQDSGIQLLD